LIIFIGGELEEKEILAVFFIVLALSQNIVTFTLVRDAPKKVRSRNEELVIKLKNIHYKDTDGYFVTKCIDSQDYVYGLIGFSILADLPFIGGAIIPFVQTTPISNMFIPSMIFFGLCFSSVPLWYILHDTLDKTEKILFANSQGIDVWRTNTEKDELVMVIKWRSINRVHSRGGKYDGIESPNVNLKLRSKEGRISIKYRWDNINLFSRDILAYANNAKFTGFGIKILERWASR
jgi:hypothetical protein